MRGLDGKLWHTQKAASKDHEVEGAPLNAVGVFSSVSMLGEDQNLGLPVRSFRDHVTPSFPDLG